MLVLAGTPIGNLGDASPRLREAFETAGIIAAEDTRTTAGLMRALGIGNRPRLVALHDHNEDARAAEIVHAARETDVLIVSDAGMPTVSDPGYAVVRRAVDAGVEVRVIPGPSAALAALAVSGLATDRFTFEGFAPRKAGERARVFASLVAERRTMIFFDSPSRLGDTLAAMVTAFGAERRVSVSRELTKLYEQTQRGTLGNLASALREGVRGEVVIVVEGAPDEHVALEDAVHTVVQRVAAGERLKAVTTDVAGLTGHAARDLYDQALAARERL